MIYGTIFKIIPGINYLAYMQITLDKVITTITIPGLFYLWDKDIFKFYIRILHKYNSSSLIFLVRSILKHNVQNKTSWWLIIAPAPTTPRSCNLLKSVWHSINIFTINYVCKNIKTT